MSGYRGTSWSQLNRNQQLGLGVGAFCVLSVIVYGVGTLTGFKPGQPTGPVVVTSQQAPVATPSASRPAPTSEAHAAAAIDQAGDPGTPCAMTYRPDGDSTVVTFQFKTSGEIITHLGSVAGDLFRHDDTVEAGARSYVDAVALNQVDDAGAILQDPDGTRHVCSIAPQR